MQNPTGLLPGCEPSRLSSSVMQELRAAAPQVGLAMGLIFAVVGLTLGNYGLVGLGVVVALVGHFSRKPVS